MNKEHNQFILLLFIIVLSLAVRLYNIHTPVVGWHSWRMADYAATAQNFYEKEMNILKPTVNHTGNEEIVVDADFQLYSFIVASIYFLFGKSDFWGRFVSLLSFTMLMFYLFKLVKQLFNYKIAFISILLYSVIPLNIYYSRAFMPQMMTILFGVLSLYYLVI